MKLITTLLLLCTFQIGFTQQTLLDIQDSKKGDFYVYWGWNRGWFTNSDIHFTGTNYDFILENVIATDRPTPFKPNIYFNPTLFTIPQYNIRVGYFLNEHYHISLGTDHMKYVVLQNQTTKVSGNISGTKTAYDGSYENEDIKLKPDFLQLEHTDGLNYVHAAFRRFDNVLDFEKMKINLTEGIGIGFLLPRTRSILFNQENHDEFNLSGFGWSMMAGINMEFFRIFFIQPEIKGGYINMPSIRTTHDPSDKASQSFFFSQFNVVFGVNINLKKKK